MACAMETHTLGTLAALGPQLAVINHLTQAGYTRQASSSDPDRRRTWRQLLKTHHALIALNDRAGVHGLNVADNEELVGQFASGIQQRRKYFWLAFMVRIRHS